jgi:hypothetical protein
MSLVQQFLDTHYIPDVMVPDEIMQTSVSLSRILKSIFGLLEKAHNCEYNPTKEFCFNCVEKETNYLPVEYQHFISDFNIFFIKETIKQNISTF